MLSTRWCRVVAASPLTHCRPAARSRAGAPPSSAACERLELELEQEVDAGRDHREADAHRGPDAVAEHETTAAGEDELEVIARVALVAVSAVVAVAIPVVAPT